MLIRDDGPRFLPKPPVPPPPPKPPRTKANPLDVIGAVAHDVFEVARRVEAVFKGLAVSPATTPSTPLPKALSAADLESAQQTIALASDGRSAQPVAQWLTAHPDPATQDQFVKLLFEFGPVAGEVLDKGANLPPEDQQLLADAVARAWDGGVLAQDALRHAVAAGGYGAAFGESHAGLAQILGRTARTDLITAYVDREMEIMPGEAEQARAEAVATALGALPPADLQGYLAKRGDAVRTSLGFLRSDPDEGWSPALGSLLDASAAIQPPTKESLAVFDTAVPLLGENRDSRRAAASFFTRNAEAVLAGYEADSAKLGLDGQQKLSAFFARTLFTDPPYEGQDVFRSALMDRLSTMTSSLDAHASENPPRVDAQRNAQLLGSLVGTIEGGFHVAVREMDQRNEAVKGMVDFLFKGADLIPAGKLPGAGILKGMTVDAIEGWVVDHLQEHAQSPTEALPFHALFGERIDSVALATIYDAARSEAFTNRGTGLVR